MSKSNNETGSVDDSADLEHDISIQDAANATVWMPGLVIDGATLVGKIATGGMAEIWLARKSGHKGFEKMVVIKKILDSFLADDGFVEMFLDEARTAAQLNHPNIIQIYDLGKHERSYFIQMEYVAGETLSRVAKAAAKAGTFLKYEYAAKIIAEAAAGLAYAHTKVGPHGKPLNIVHRDVSPQNIMVAYDGVVKVLDFGVAKAANRATKTEAGRFKGKVSYMSPEQARGQEIDGRADVFSLGIVLYELIGRCRLFQHADMVEGLNAVSAHTPIPSPVTRNFEVPDALAEITLKALERDPARRYQSARELQLALEGWLSTPPGAPSTQELGTHMHELFSARIGAQQKMLDAIRLGDSSAFKAPTRMTYSELPMISAAPAEKAGAKKKPSSKLPAVLIGALALLVAGTGVAIGLKKSGSSDTTTASATSATLAVESEPPGAMLWLDGKEVGATPVVLPDVAVGEHALKAALDQYAPTERTIKILERGEKAHVVISLKPLPPESAPVVDALPPLTDNAARSPSVAKGKLTLSTTPWAEVYEGRKKLGDTPLVDLPLPAGKHTLKLLNPDKKLSKTVTVEIKPGQTTALKQKL